MLTILYTICIGIFLLFLSFGISQPSDFFRVHIDATDVLKINKQNYENSMLLDFNYSLQRKLRNHR